MFAGFYQVMAAKSGCAAPGHPAQPTVSTPVFQVPPPRTGIVLTLNCPGAAPPAKPKVTSLSVTSGPGTGGTAVDLHGSGFTSAATVRFGTAKAKAVTVLTPTEITVTTPAGKGTVDVAVTTAGGTSARSAADRFAYRSPPAVTKIAPHQGRAAGGTAVTVTGKGFAAGDQVMFGATQAASVTVISGGKIVATAPAGSGLIDIRVISSAGRSAAVEADRYGFLAKPSFVSAKSASATRGQKFIFTVRTAGYPFATITESGRLPAGLSFKAHANGTATISGKPIKKGRFTLKLAAKNSLGTARQSLTITVKQ